MSGVPHAELSAYFAEASRWDEDRLRSARRSRNVAWIVAIGASLIAVTASAAVASLAPLKTVEPFVVRVDRATGAVDVMTSLTQQKGLPPDEAVSKYFLARYVRSREGYLPAAAAEDFRQVAILSSPAEQRRFGDTRASSHPQNPAILYGRDAAAEVQIRAVSFINDKVASIRFRRVVRRAQVSTSEDWIATAAFTYTRAPMGESDRLLNPLGFQITSYRADPEATP
jgi:type IV secretion system protein VirB8